LILLKQILPGDAGYGILICLTRIVKIKKARIQSYIYIIISISLDFFPDPG